MSRRLARELAFQILFQVDIGHIPWKEALRRSVQENDLPEKSLMFLEKLVSGAISNLDQIDGILSQFSVEWPLNRMANTDRNLLRLAVYELMNLKDIPVEVTVNEAVEMAKVYGEEDSGRFVNGVLGNLIREISKTMKIEDDSHRDDSMNRQKPTANFGGKGLLKEPPVVPEEAGVYGQKKDTKQELNEFEDR